MRVLAPAALLAAALVLAGCSPSDPEPAATPTDDAPALEASDAGDDPEQVEPEPEESEDDLADFTVDELSAEIGVTEDPFGVSYRHQLVYDETIADSHDVRWYADQLHAWHDSTRLNVEILTAETYEEAERVAWAAAEEANEGLGTFLEANFAGAGAVSWVGPNAVLSGEPYTAGEWVLEADQNDDGHDIARLILNTSTFYMLEQESGPAWAQVIGVYTQEWGVGSSQGLQDTSRTHLQMQGRTDRCVRENENWRLAPMPDWDTADFIENGKDAVEAPFDGSADVTDDEREC